MLGKRVESLLAFCQVVAVDANIDLGESFLLPIRAIGLPHAMNDNGTLSFIGSVIGRHFFHELVGRAKVSVVSRTTEQTDREVKFLVELAQRHQGRAATSDTRIDI